MWLGGCRGGSRVGRLLFHRWLARPGRLCCGFGGGLCCGCGAGAGPELRRLVLLVELGDFSVGDLLRDFVDEQPALGNEVFDLGTVRFSEAGLLASRIGEILLVILEERPQFAGAGRLDLVSETADVDRNDLRRRRLRHPPEVVPAESGRITGETALEQDQHVLGEQFVTQCLEEVVLRDARPAGAEPHHDLFELIGAHLTIGQFGEEIVDRRIADDDAVFRPLFSQKHRPHDGLLFRRKPGRLCGIPASRHRRLGEEPVEDELHRHCPVESLLTQFTAVPLRDRCVGQGGGLPAVLKERGEDEERQHGKDGKGHHRGLLVGPKNAEASHGTA